jgi:indolepyruvate ferredoxin oxidoreductase
MTLRPVSLDDKYDLKQSHVLVTGYQALIRACLMQKARDKTAGLNTGGYLTGYRGSPLGGLDQQFMRAGRELAGADIKFQPGINEELAATALWGAQQAELRGEGKFDGVFGLWYGKGPGVDRSATCSATPICRYVEARRRARFDGRRPHRRILHHRAPVRIPLRRCNDADPQSGRRAGDLDYALYGWAMSRFTGAWTALKCMHETIESTGVVDGSVDRLQDRHSG